MKNNLSSPKNYFYVVLAAFGALLSVQSFAQGHGGFKDGGGKHERSYSPGNFDGGHNGNYAASRTINDNRSFHQNSNRNYEVQRPPRMEQRNYKPAHVLQNDNRATTTIQNNKPAPVPQANRPIQNNNTAAIVNNNNANNQRPNRKIVNNDNTSYTKNTTINKTNIYNKTVNNYTYGKQVSFNNYRPVYNAYNPSWRYNHYYFPRVNTIIDVFPYGYTSLNYGGYGYRYYNGIYYRPYLSSYIVCTPPFGIFINTLPFGYRRIYVNDYPYYYYNGTYYDETSTNNYKVVQPPLGAVVESIPEGYETLTIDGETFYKVDGVQYKPVVQENGEIWYQVIKVDGVQSNN